MCYKGGDFTNHNGTGGKSIYGEKVSPMLLWTAGNECDFARSLTAARILVSSLPTKTLRSSTREGESFPWRTVSDAAVAAWSTLQTHNRLTLAHRRSWQLIAGPNTNVSEDVQIELVSFVFLFLFLCSKIVWI